MTDHDDGVSRRKVLECMTWVGTGVLWTISGGVPHSLGLIDQALAADAKGLTFLQISDSHIGFDKPANPNAKGTLEEAIERIKAIQTKPAFMIHTGDITHLSKELEFDDAEKIISQAKLEVHYVPGEHDVIDPEIKLYKERYGRGTKGPGITASMPMACTSSVLSTSPISRAGAWAVSATSSSNGWRMISKVARRRRRSWCSRISRCGRSIRSGAGAPRTAAARSPT